MGHDSTISIAGRRIGPGEPVYLVAELSANHGGSLDHALRVVRMAAACGVDAIKLQTYTADTMTLDLDEPPFRIEHDSPWKGRTLHDLYEEAHTPWEWHPPLKRAADEAGLALFSTPFDFTAVDFLESLDVPAMKIASFELLDLPLIERVARTGKPLIMSTGMATRAEIKEAVQAARGAGNRQIVLLQCTSAYPATPSEMNLRTIPDLAASFGVAAGLSDHTMGTAVPIAAVALGACLIEKHVCLSRGEGGPDSAFPLEPDELRQLVADVRTAEAALGGVSYEPGEKERQSRVFRRSLFVVEDVPAGAPFTKKNVRAIRPGHGLLPKHLPAVLGRHAAQAIRRGTPLSWDLVADPSES